MKLTDQVQKAQVKNILAKLKAGKTITKREQSAVEAYERGQEPPKTTRELAAHYGVSHVAIIKWGKAGCPLSSIEEIDAWKAAQLATKSPENLTDAKLRKTLLECERLDMDVQRIRRELISVTAAAETNQTIASVLCSEGQAMISDLRGQLAGLDEITIGERLTARWTQLLQATVQRLQEQPS
jgi:hypothetical protein